MRNFLKNVLAGISILRHHLYFFILMLGFAVFMAVGYNMGYEQGQQDGFSQMYFAVTGRVNNILSNQTQSDTTVTRLGFEVVDSKSRKVDTVSYFLSRRYFTINQPTIK